MSAKVSGWGAVPKVASVSLNEIMSEQVAQKLAEDEERFYAIQIEAIHGKSKDEENLLYEQNVPYGNEEELDEDFKLALKLDAEMNGPSSSSITETKTHSIATNSNTNSDTNMNATSNSINVSSAEDSDLALALLLQAELDSEFNHELNAMENHWNAKSKVTVSYQNHLIQGPHLPIPEPKRYGADDEIDTDEDEDVKDKDGKSKEKKVRRKKKKPSPTEKREIITKHDILINSMKNAKKAEELPIIAVGKTSDLKIPNTVFNSLKRYATRVENIHESRGKTRLFDKDDYATEDRVLDKKTKLIILQMINSGQIGGLGGIISTGKEANVYHGTALIPYINDKNEPVDEPEFEQECAIKIFKTTLNEFKNREAYIKEDHRFKDKMGKDNSGKLIQLWAQKELSNLHRLQSIGIRCPEILFFSKHVLVMTLVGKDGKAAPKLREVAKFLSDTKKTELYQQCVEAMRKMYQNAGLVHADLSEYNTLYHEGNLWFIDVSQSVEKSHPKSRVFLYRDCHNMSNYFSSIGVETLSPIELFSLITMESFNSQSKTEIVEEVRNFVKDTIGEEEGKLSLEEILQRIVPKTWEEIESELAQMEDDESEM